MNQKRLQVIISSLSENFKMPVSIFKEGNSPTWVQDGSICVSTDKIAELLKGSGMDDAKGIIYKETAHAISSDMNVMRYFDDNHKADPEGLFKNKEEKKNFGSIFNALEDLRAEKILAGKYEGVDEDIKDLMSHASKYKSDNSKDIDALTNALYMNTAYKEEAEKVIDKKLLDAVKDLEHYATDARDAKDTREVLKIASKMYRELFDKAPPPPDGEGKGDDKDGEGDKSDGKDGDKEGEGQPGEGDEEGNTKDGGSGEGESDGDKESDDLADAIQKGGARAGRAEDAKKVPTKSMTVDPEIEPEGEGSYAVHPKVLAKDEIVSGKKVKADLERYNKEKNIFSREISVLGRKIKDVFTLQHKNRFQGGYTSGQKIETTALPRVLVDNDRLFMKRYKQNKESVCITLLLDESGSMYGSVKGKGPDGRVYTKMAVARQSTIVLSSVLSRLNIPFEILGFTTGSTCVSSVGVGAGCTRLESLKHTIIKSYDEKFTSEVKARIGGLEAQSNNFDAEGVAWAYSRIKNRPEQSKNLWVLSDGYPAGYGLYDGVHYQSLKDVVKKIERTNVSIVGIGLETGSVAKFYKNYMVLNSACELPVEFLKLIKKVVIKDKVKRGV